MPTERQNAPLEPTYESGMTVGQLKALLARYPDDLLVVTETPHCEYRLAYRVNGPCGDEDEAQRGVCIVSGRYV